MFCGVSEAGGVEVKGHCEADGIFSLGFSTLQLPLRSFPNKLHGPDACSPRSRVIPRAKPHNLSRAGIHPRPQTLKTPKNGGLGFLATCRAVWSTGAGPGWFRAVQV